MGKLVSNYEGLYRVTAIAGVGAYYLEDMEERPLPRPWSSKFTKVLSLTLGGNYKLYTIVA